MKLSARFSRWLNNAARVFSPRRPSQPVAAACAPDVSPYDEAFALLTRRATSVHLNAEGLAALTNWYRNAVVLSRHWPTSERDALLSIAAELLPPIHTSDIRGPTAIAFWRDRVNAVWLLEERAASVLGTYSGIAEELFDVLSPAHAQRIPSEAP